MPQVVGHHRIMLIVIIVSILIMLSIIGYVISFGWILQDTSQAMTENDIKEMFDGKPKDFSPRYDMFDVAEKASSSTTALPDNSFGAVPLSDAGMLINKAMELAASPMSQEEKEYWGELYSSAIVIGNASPMAKGSEVETGIVHSI